MADVPELRVPADAGSVRRARHWVTFLARQHGASGRSLTLVELLTSEVVTNAVRHAPSTADLAVRLRRVDHSITVEVDDDSDTAPRAVTRELGQGGWGIRFVEHMASDWGVAPRPRSGKTVWFCVPLHVGEIPPVAVERRHESRPVAVDRRARHLPTGT